MKSWEDICRRCGACCFEKWIEPDGRIRTTKTACRFLDPVTRQCKVYHKRLEVGEGCVKLTPKLLAEIDWMPSDCAYLEWSQSQA